MIFRQAAITKGMKVNEVKEINGLPEGCDPQEHWVEYVLPVSARLDIKHPIVLRRSSDHVWELPDALDRRPLTENLSVLPEGIVQITIKQMSVIALWNERGEKGAVDHIYAVLAAF